jgi:hypothetical protein
MQIKYLNNGVVKHVTNEVGRGFIDAGLAVEIPSATPAPKPNLKWIARPGEYIGDYQAPPYIYQHCDSCGWKGATEPSKDPDKLQVRHCLGVVEKVPADVVKQYLALFHAYRSRSRKATRRPEDGKPVDTFAETEAAKVNRQRLANEALSLARRS